MKSDFKSRTDDQMLLESEIATYLFRDREVPDLPGAVKEKQYILTHELI